MGYYPEELLNAREAIAIQASKIRNGVNLIAEGDIDNDFKMRIELVGVLKETNPDLDEKETVEEFVEMNRAVGTNYFIEAIKELGNPANKEKYATVIKKHGDKIDILYNTCFGNIQQQVPGFTVPIPQQIQQQVGMNIQPFVVGDASSTQIPSISGSPEIDMAISLLAAPNMVIQMEAISSNVFTALLKLAETDEEKKEIENMKISVSGMLDMLKDPNQILALKQAAGYMINGNKQELEKLSKTSKAFENMYNMVLGGGCSCGHDHATA